MKTLLALLVTVSLSTSTFAQEAHFDSASTRHAVAAAAGSPPQKASFRSKPFIAGVAIGASAGALTICALTADGGRCNANATLWGAWWGGLFGALIGGVIAAHPQRRPGIPLGAHVTAAPSMSRSRSRTVGALTIAF